MNRKNQTIGFTLIEMMVVIFIIGLILPAFFSIVFTLARQQAEILILQKVKEEGDFVQTKIISLVRNKAVKINESCSGLNLPTAVSKMCFFDNNEVVFGYVVDANNRLASYSASMSEPVYLVGDEAEENLDFPLFIKTDSSVFTKIDTKTVRFQYAIRHLPKVSYLSPQELQYQFFIQLRR